jgi:hypothetical protein
MYKKRMLLSDSLKTFQKNAHKKSYKQTSLSNKSKSGKVHISVTFLVITFLVHFSSTFPTDRKST